jgi:hypothetical protein
MLTYKTGQKAGKGTYWDVSSGQRIDVLHEAVLPGRDATFIKSSPGIILLAAPVIGMLYALWLPFIGIATTATLAVGVVTAGIYNLAVKSVSFGWHPEHAYFSGKKKRNQGL